LLVATMKASVLNRKLHRWGAILTAIPMLIVIVSGLFLQLKKEFDWIQPPTAKVSEIGLSLSFEQILASAKTATEAGFTSWDDIDRLDVRPGKGIIKVRGKNRWEVQLDAQTGAVMQTAYRRSDFFEQLHDGSWFHDKAKLWLFLPAAIILLGLWFTGIYLWFLPHLVRRRKRRAQHDWRPEHVKPKAPTE
jgi:uncharacterized iron-regulated membrane protein